MAKLASDHWVKTGPSTYERGIDSFDTLFTLIGQSGQGRPDRLNWEVSTGIKVDTARSTFADDVKAAWIALCFEFPGLAALLVDGRWIYRTADDEHELSSWLVETLHIHHNTTKTARQLYPYEEGPTRRPSLHVFPHTQELVFQGAHTQIDAIGGITFLNHVLRFLVAPPPASPPVFGGEGVNLAPPVSATIEAQPITPAQQKRWDECLGGFTNGAVKANLWNENKGAPARRTRQRWLTFTAEETARIVARTRELGLTVGGVAQAALSLSSRIHGRDLTAMEHSTFGIYDARPLIDPAKYPHDRLVNYNVLCMPATYPLNPDDFVATARSCRRIIQDPKDDGTLVNAHALFGRDMEAALTSPPPPNTPVVADIQLSSVGVLDKFIRSHYRGDSAGSRPNVEVRDVWVSIDLLSPNTAVEVYTFRGRLVVNFIYNEVYHREEGTQHLMALLHEHLTQGLGLDLGFDCREAGSEDWLTPVDEKPAPEALKNGMLETISRVLRGEVDEVY